LAHSTRDSSQADKKINVVTSGADAQNDNYFTQIVKVVILRGNKCHFVKCSACNNSYFLSQLEISQVLNEPTAKTNTDVEDSSKNHITSN